MNKQENELKTLLLCSELLESRENNLSHLILIQLKDGAWRLSTENISPKEVLRYMLKVCWRLVSGESMSTPLANEKELVDFILTRMNAQLGQKADKAVDEEDVSPLPPKWEDFVDALTSFLSNDTKR